MNRLPFFAQWTISTLIGWALGLFLWFAVIWLGWEALPRLIRFPFSMLSLWRFGAYILAMAALGGGIGFAQWKIAFGMRNFPGKLWTFTSAFGGASIIIGVFLASLLAVPIMQTPANDQPNITLIVADTWLPGALVVGFAIGLCVGLPQAFLLRRYVRGARWWLGTTLVATIAVSISFVLIIRYFGGEFLGLAVACATIPLLFGIITGATMQHYLSE